MVCLNITTNRKFAFLSQFIVMGNIKKWIVDCVNRVLTSEFTYLAFALEKGMFGARLTIYHVRDNQAASKISHKLTNNWAN